MFIFALTYLLAPVFLILFTFFSIPFVLMSAVALVVLVFCLYKSHNMEHADHFSTRILSDCWPLLIIAAVISCLCLISPFKFWDWEKHYAVFNLLIGSTWPPVIELDGQPWFLRYYAAWYVMPALLAKAFGPLLLTSAMIFWTATGVFITMFLAFYKIRKISHLFLVAAVFFLFSGLDIVGIFYHGHIEEVTPHWLQWWGAGGYMGSYLFSLSLLPQHTIGTCLSACLFIYNRQLAVRYGALIIVAIAMWSPFCAIGLAPVAILALVKEGYGSAFTYQNLLAAPLIAIPIVLYLMQGTGEMPFMFVWQWKGFNFEQFILFMVSEVILIVTILLYIKGEEKDLVVATFIFFLFLCIFRGGPHGELFSRGTVAGLCTLSILAGKALFQNSGWRREILVVYLLIGAFPVLVAFAKSISSSTSRVDKRTTAETLNFKYPLEEKPFTTYYLAKQQDATYVAGISLLRTMPTEE